jgi:hypothetical protein
MALAYCNVARRNIRVSLAWLLLTVVASLHPQGAGAQSCRGDPEQGCLNPGAACEAPGIAHGTCNTVSGRSQTERECRCTGSPATPAPPPPQPTCQAINICPGAAPLANNLFYIRDLGHRCMDAGLPQSWATGAPVSINACNGSAGQQIRVTEIDSVTHDVGLSVEFIPTNAAPNSVEKSVDFLKAQQTATGATNAIFCIGVHGGTIAPGAALELQSCDSSSPAQRFAVDGDAIFMGWQTPAPASKNPPNNPKIPVSREFVIERQNGSTVAQTPLVVALRDLWEEEQLRIDARYFRFDAVDGSGAAPTSGFLTVKDEAHLICAAQCGWGTVVQIDDHQPLELTTLPNPGIVVGNGTTIRGYRNYTNQGPEIHTCVANADWPAFEILGQEVRFTGLRLLGPSADSSCSAAASGTPNEAENTIQVMASDGPSGPVLPSFWIDNTEVSNWPGAAVQVWVVPSSLVPANPPPYPDAPYARLIGNSLHDNLYGSNTAGLFTQVRANVFYGNNNQPVTSRVDSCAEGYQGYAAVDNLFLTEHAGASSDDVDMHGNENPGDWYNGVAGDYFDVGSNTFLATDTGNYAANVNQRGQSCRFTKVHDNVFLQSQANAIHDPCSNCSSWPPAIESNNTFSAQDPTQGTLLVGDMDGDGIDDVLLATGAAWYYSSGGQAEWRYLNRMPELASNLLLGDFDGDGRSDVMTIHGSNGGNVDVSWAGVSPWQTINVVAWPLSDLAVGDFDGDGRSDLLLATGTQWFFASGGRNWEPFVVNTEDYTDTIPNLRFGHFTDKSKTQILRVQNSRWQVTEWGMTSWQDIGAAPTNSVSGLVAGDFDGQGYTELATSNPQPHGRGIPTYEWQYTSPGHNSLWVYLGTSSSPITPLPIGRFEGGEQSGVIQWINNGFSFTYLAGAKSTSQLLSRQVMR